MNGFDKNKSSNGKSPLLAREMPVSSADIHPIGISSPKKRHGSGLALYLKECKKVLCSLTFLLYTLAVFAMYYTQFHGELNSPEAKPEPGGNYGMVAREDPEILVPSAVNSLIGEYLNNNYQAYPFGFVKYIHLLEKKQDKMAAIIEQVSGIPKEKLDKYNDYTSGRLTIGQEIIIGEDNQIIYQKPELPEISIPETLTYERFRELMREADDLIGGGSRYSDDYLVLNFSLVPQTYEEALAEYNRLTGEDKITRSYARLYCDYISILLTILPVFVAVSFTVLDKRARMEQLIRAKAASSVKIIFTRYTALVTTMFLPVIVISLIAQAMVVKLYPGMTVDLSAFPRYAVAWLLPDIMISTSVGVLFAELFSVLPAIFLQGIWWFGSIFAGSGQLTGNIGKFSLVIRHNSLYKSDIFQENFNNLVFNRIFFATASLGLVVLAVFVYNQKRKGFSYGIQIFNKTRGNKYKA